YSKQTFLKQIPIAKRAAYRVTNPREPSVTKFIAVSNRRGGVGKTTMTMMLAYGLSVGRRQKVLLIDLDAQASTSIVMMGHQRWRAAREANRTAAGLLAQLAGSEPIKSSDYIA